MNTSNYVIVATLAVIIIAMAGWASGTSPSSALYDQTGISTTIDATCIGTFIVNHDMEWGQTNNPNASLLNLALTPDERRAIFAYRENTLGADGTTRYNKQYNMEGSNVSNGRDNLYASHALTFQTNDSGRLWYDEEGTVNVAGTPGASDPNKCVFALGSGGNGAGYDATVSAGSVMNVEEVSAVTEIGARAISENSNIPVNLRYGFDAQGLGTNANNTLAKGSAEVHMVTNSVTGDTTDGSQNATTKIYDRQRTAANGLFDLAETHGYNSGTT